MYQDLDEAIDDMTKAGGRHPVDRKDMWRELWRKAVDNDKFWQTEFVDKAVLVRLKLKEMGDVVDGDAPVEGSTAASLMADSAKQAGAPAVVTAGAEQKRPADAWPEGTNKKNKALCGDFQSDACGPCARGTVICHKDSSKRHQCVLCNGNHPACRCDGSGWWRPGGKPAGKGQDPWYADAGPSWKGKKGKGKGKNKGKGGKKGQRNGKGKGQWQNADGWNSGWWGQGW